MARCLCATFLICLLLFSAGCRHRDGLASGASPLECEFYDYGSDRGASDAKNHSNDYRAEFQKDPPSAIAYISVNVYMGIKEDPHAEKMALKMGDLCGKDDGTADKATKAFIAGYKKGYETSL